MVAKINRVVRLFLITFWCLIISLKPASASELTLISDAETQNYLADIVKPLFNAAGIPFNANNIFIVKDNSLNAFVSDGNYLFINTGTLLEAENTNELSGILAHETGHIMGGHIVRQKLKLESLQYVMLGSLIAAGATAVSTGRGDAAMAVILGAQSSAINNLLHYQVQEERSADESAVRLLGKTNQSTDGLKKFMQKIKKKNALSGIEENSYFRTHPMTTERIRHFEDASKNNHFKSLHPLDNDLKMIKAKLAGFLLDKNKINRLYPISDNSIEAGYAKSILSFRNGDVKNALSLADNLVEKQPQNPYFYELKGQFLFESGKAKESISSYEQALKLLPGNYLLQISLAHAILESYDDKANLQRAIDLLQKSLITQNNAFSWRLLAQAYEKIGKRDFSLYASAEFNYMTGSSETAEKQLSNAIKMSQNSTLKLKIKDLQERIKADKKNKL